VAVTQEISDGVSKLVEQASSTEAAAGVKQLKKDWQTIRKAGHPDDEETFSNIPDGAYKTDLFGLEKARLECRLQMVLIVQEVRIFRFPTDRKDRLKFGCTPGNPVLTLYALRLTKLREIRGLP
jgi:hypothetical protein